MKDAPSLLVSTTPPESHVELNKYQKTFYEALIKTLGDWYIVNKADSVEEQKKLQLMLTEEEIKDKLFLFSKKSFSDPLIIFCRLMHKFALNKENGFGVPQIMPLAGLRHVDFSFRLIVKEHRYRMINEPSYRQSFAAVTICMMCFLKNNLDRYNEKSLVDLFNGTLEDQSWEGF